MTTTMDRLDNEIQKFVKGRGLKGYSMTIAPNTKGEDHAEAMLLALSAIDSPNNRPLEV